MVELRALGPIDLRRDGAEVTSVLTQPKRLALLLFLDFARPYGFHKRERLIALLWPELDDTHGRNALTREIDEIRRELGENAIVTRGEDVMLDPVYIRSSVRVLDAAVTNGDHTRVIQLFQGTVADGFSLKEAPAFQQWLDDERKRIRDAVADAAWALALKSKESGRIEDATAFARSAVSLTRDDEESVRRLMAFLESVGDRDGALRAYDEFAVWISGETSAYPSPDTDALRDKIENSETIELTPPTGSTPIAPRVTPPSPVKPAVPVATAIPEKPEKKERIHWAAVGVAGMALVLLLAAYVFASGH